MSRSLLQHACVNSDNASVHVRHVREREVEILFTLMSRILWCVFARTHNLKLTDSHLQKPLSILNQSFVFCCFFFSLEKYFVCS